MVESSKHGELQSFRLLPKMTLTSSLVGQCLECPLPLALPQGPSGPDHSGKSRPTEFTGMAPISEWWGSNRGPANKVGHSSLCLVLLLL